ncbi:RING-H2 finger protein [Candidatus Dependentiae bacterium]|nr:MAG: RING-H2 finger protein [Candidatus Dependentiae bacterium]
MNKKKFASTAFTFAIFAWASNCFAVSELGPEEIRSYVENTLEHLLGKYKNSDPDAREDISAIKEQTLTSSKSILWERILNFQVEHTLDEVKNNLLTSIIDFVEQQSYRYAYDKTHNVYIAKKVAKNMVNAVTTRIIKESGEFKDGTLSQFVGKELQETVNEQCNRFNAMHDTRSIQIIKCNICKEKFVELECVSLSPCNHIVCKKCVHESLLNHPGKLNCPRCSKQIDRNDLDEKINEEPVNKSIN